MNLINLEEHLAVSGQIDPSDVEHIAAAGYRVLVNNRPDGEVPGQPSHSDIAAAAEAAGMAYHYLPVNAVNYPGADLSLLRSLFDDPSRPVLAFCRTGTRCTNLWVSSREEHERDAAINRALALGFDLSMAVR